MKLYHATTKKKAELYKQTGYIKLPVRGFTTLQASMCWALSIEGKRTVFYEIETDDITDHENVHKLPDHHNEFGTAWWIDSNVPVKNIKCVLSV